MLKHPPTIHISLLNFFFHTLNFFNARPPFSSTLSYSFLKFQDLAQILSIFLFTLSNLILCPSSPSFSFSFSHHVSFLFPLSLHLISPNSHSLLILLLHLQPVRLSHHCDCLPACSLFFVEITTQQQRGALKATFANISSDSPSLCIPTHPSRFSIFRLYLIFGRPDSGV